MTNPNFPTHLQRSRIFALFLQEGQFLKSRCEFVPHIQQLRQKLSHTYLNKLERLLPYKSLWNGWFLQQDFLNVSSILQVNLPQTFISLIRIQFLCPVYLINKPHYKVILILAFSWADETKCVTRFVNPIPVTWALQQEGKIILVQSSPLELEKQHHVSFYFDQGGTLTTKFGIDQVPARVSQQSKTLLIEMMPPNYQGRKELTDASIK